MSTYRGGGSRAPHTYRKAPTPATEGARSQRDLGFWRRKMVLLYYGTVGEANRARNSDRALARIVEDIGRRRQLG